MSDRVPPIELANIVPGARLLSQDERGVNETFLGFVDTESARLKAYIKVLPGKQLVNELVATTIGRAVGLPIPRGFLALARPEDLPESVRLKTHATEACVFASESLDPPDLRRRISLPSVSAAGLLAGWKDWDAAAVFDDWIANGDRHDGNILVGKPGEVWLIDHGHSMTGPDWSPGDLVPGRKFQNRLADLRAQPMTLSEKTRLLDVVARTAARFEAADGDGAISASFADRLLSSDEVRALRVFLGQRVRELSSIMAARLGLPHMRRLI